MVTKRRSQKRNIPDDREWLPIDIGLVPNIVSFGRVTGAARVFLWLEIVLSILVVIGTSFLVLVRFAS